MTSELRVISSAPQFENMRKCVNAISHVAKQMLSCLPCANLGGNLQFNAVN